MQAIAPFLTGLGLFFCGVHYVAANLVPLAGRRFRGLLMRMGRSPWMVAVFGTVAGIITQSANAVTAIIIGLVSGGLVDKRRSILIPTWSHVGTSVLVILVAIDLRLAASYLVVLAGCAVYFGFDRNDRVRLAIGTLLGLGLLFLGMQSIKSGAEPLRDYLVQSGLMASISHHPGLLLLVGVALSLACQSSSVAGALAVAASSAGLLDLSGACWVIYGANLGSGFNFALLAKAHQGEAAQIALMQAAQKLAGFAVAMLLVGIEQLSGRPLIESTIASLSSSLTAQVAWVFLLYQVAGSAVCTVFVGPILAVLERVAPPSKLQEMSKPAYLIEDALVEPTFAIDLVVREEQRLLARLPTMLDSVRADAEGEPIPPSTLRSAAAMITRTMAGYLESISEGRLERTDREQVVRLQHRAANLNAMHESLDEFVTACVSARQWPSSGRVADQMIESLHALLNTLVEAAAANDPEEQDMLLSLLGHRDEMMERIRQRVLREDPNMPPKSQEALFAATMLFERVVWLARRCAILLNPERAAGSEQSAPLPAEIDRMTNADAKILVVDDVAENRDLLLRRLTRLGFHLIDQAANGIEALAAIGSKAYDLVLLDIMMPELDGFGVLEKLRGDGRINLLPVIVISAMGEIEAVVRCIELGAADFIAKPFNPTLLRARVLSTLEKKALSDLTREELRRKQLELNEARTLQLALAPPPFSGVLGGRAFSIDVLLEPAKEVGGDLVDHFCIGDDMVVLALGDVSDKGAGAALMMARTHAMLRALTARPDAAALFREPARALGIVNAALSSGNDSCMFVTFLLVALDIANGKLAYVRAGHIPPFHRNGTGKVARLGRMGGPPLGLIENTVYQPDTVTLSPGDRLLIVTDGFTEAHDPGNAVYGEARVEAFLTDLDASEGQPLKRLAGRVRAFEAGRPAFDDMAAILLSLEPESPQ